jgi:nitrate reductase delta subunit
MDIYRLAAHLLAYPDAQLQAALPALAGELRGEYGLPAALRQDLERAMQDLASADLLDLQEVYVGTFDRIRSLSLHLFEHVHSDTRQRGPAMLDLVELYRANGLDVTASELPDYLPLFLEFLSTLDSAQAARHLGDAGDILGVLHDRLVKRASPYAAVFAVLLHLAGATATPLDEAPEQLDYAALDRAWDEAAVAFGPDNNPATAGGCDQAATMVARMNAPVETRE